MATKGLFIGRSVQKIWQSSSKQGSNLVPKRTLVYSDTGAVLPEPERMRLALPKVFLTVIPFLTTGAIISKNGAAILEEMEIFVPDDDDD